ncbi:hypothetical protein [Clostridium fallax]|uniref:Uncharacterized protein n=1 Tax=Clostridium fallax TaxID=1533 RepID=A0A1M4XJY1_9CLOT|nr:hypothetical protein [Clostridium fallax]SHE93730.1 hypothetical protein SAMN05443638_1195 [Clostridium fallax]SQB06377.1 Uncharacterised protein [Clostridium fallax]
MAKKVKEIKVYIEGQFTDEIKINFNKRLAKALYKQYGIDFCRELLEELKESN